MKLWIAAKVNSPDGSDWDAVLPRESLEPPDAFSPLSVDLPDFPIGGAR